MPFFNFRRGQNLSANSQGAAPESAETLRRRAKHRLIGSAVLVLAGVIGFPLVFDNQPRPVAVDIPIEIPGKASVKPLVLPPAMPPASSAIEVAAQRPTSTASASSAPPVTPPNRTLGEKVAASASLTDEEEIIVSKTAPVQVNKDLSATKSEAKTTAQPTQPQPKTQSSSKSEGKPSAAEESARARALLNGTTPPPSAAIDSGKADGSSERFIVQVGAFAEVLKAREARLKVEGAGLKTYTQVTQTAAGKRIRVRVGPFATRAEADRAASKIKALGLAAAILTL